MSIANPGGLATAMGSEIEEPGKGARGKVAASGARLGEQPRPGNSETSLKKEEEDFSGDRPAEQMSDVDQQEYERHLDLLSSFSFSEGDVVRGTVLKVTPSEVLVNVGYKSDGIVDLREFTDRDGTVRVKAGDQFDFLVEKTESSEGYIVLSREKAEKMKVWDRVEEAYRDNKVVTGRVIDRVKGGLAVDIGVRAFLPGSLVDVRPVRNLDSLKNQEFRMKIIKFNKKRGNIVLSRKQVLEEEGKEKRAKTLEALAEGAVLRGQIKNLTEYGAFVDLGGVSGLLHITDMSWGRVSSPTELFQIGDEIDVVVLKYDRETGRVALGYKQLSQDPWITARATFPVGARVTGRVVSLTDYGAFVELAPGVEGLVHVSEMSWTKRIKHPSKRVSIGDEVDAIVLDVDDHARRISLGMKQAEANPWDTIADRYHPGDKVRGKVRNLTDFGAFVELEEGIDGLIHISDLSWTKRVRHPSEILKKGDDVEAMILTIDAQNQRLSLGLKQLQNDVWQDFFGKHQVGDRVTGKVVRLTDFGAFVELEEGVEGLVHVSELARERVEKPSDRVSEGEELTMKIIRLDQEEKRIGLSVKAADESADIRAYSDPRRTRVSLGEMLGDLPRELKEGRRRGRDDRGRGGEEGPRKQKGGGRRRELEDDYDYRQDLDDDDEGPAPAPKAKDGGGEDDETEAASGGADDESGKP
ncbi:MAG: 30S ribosomal protein S1 [Acidobacteriota bacterium]